MTYMPELQTVFDRLERLESQNRRLKTAGVLALVVVSALVLMAQVKPASRVVEASEFILRDPEGRMRAHLSISRGVPVLDLLDVTGKAVARLDPSTLALMSKKGVGILSVDNNGSYLSLSFAMYRAVLHPDELSLDGAVGMKGINLGFLANAPSLKLSDGEGYRTEIGSTILMSTLTGETHKTSAASLAMFGKDGKVIWRAP
jgi:hypothetical protein